MKYLLSTGKVTEKIEYYVIDLFKLYLQIYPGDVPGASTIGFDFNISDTVKAQLPKVVMARISDLVSKIQGRFSQGIDIVLESCELIDEKLAKIVVSVNQVRSEEITIKIYEDL